MGGFGADASGGGRQGIVWVSVTFGELLLHWAGSERRPGDGSSGAGHPGRGCASVVPSVPRSTSLPLPSAPLLLPSRLRSSALHVRPTPRQKASMPRKRPPTPPASTPRRGYVR